MQIVQTFEFKDDQHYNGIINCLAMENGKRINPCQSGKVQVSASLVKDGNLEYLVEPNAKNILSATKTSDGTCFTLHFPTAMVAVSSMSIGFCNTTFSNAPSSVCVSFSFDGKKWSECTQSTLDFTANEQTVNIIFTQYQSNFFKYIRINSHGYFFNPDILYITGVELFGKLVHITPAVRAVTNHKCKWIAGLPNMFFSIVELSEYLFAESVPISVGSVEAYCEAYLVMPIRNPSFVRYTEFLRYAALSFANTNPITAFNALCEYRKKDKALVDHCVALIQSTAEYISDPVAFVQQFGANACQFAGPRTVQTLQLVCPTSSLSADLDKMEASLLALFNNSSLTIEDYKQAVGFYARVKQEQDKIFKNRMAILEESNVQIFARLNMNQ